MAMEERPWEKESFKTRVENVMKMSTSGPWSENDDGEQLGDDDAPE